MNRPCRWVCPTSPSKSFCPLMEYRNVASRCCCKHFESTARSTYDRQSAPGDAIPPAATTLGLSTLTALRT